MTTHLNWVLDVVLKLDEATPGLVAAYLRASVERRHVIAALLASPRVDQINSSEAGSLLFGGGHNAILQAAYGRVPIGLRGALRRSGPQVHEPDYYRDLHGLLDSGGSVERRAISRLPELNLSRLHVIRTLPDPIRSPSLVSALGDISHAREVATLFQLFIDAGADVARLASALSAVKSRDELRGVWRRQLGSLTFPAHPVSASSRYRPITNATELRGLALGFRNCSRRYLTDCLEGEQAFAEFRASTQRLVIQLRKRSGAWFLEGCFARSNGRVDPRAREMALHYLREYGVCEFVRRSQIAGKWEPLRELMARWEFDHELDTAWG